MNDFQIARWFNENDKFSGNTSNNIPAYILDTEENSDNIKDCIVVSPTADRTKIRTLFTKGARQVLIGESVLVDKYLLQDMIKQYGKEKIGIWLPVRLTQRSWTLDRKSNVDFSFVSVSNPLPRWIVLKANGDMTDVDALTWVSEILKAGCSSIMVSIDEPQDEDLLACAEMSEIAGNKFWLNTDSSDIEEIRFWVQYGHVLQLVVPHETDIELLAVNLNTRLMQGTFV